MADPLSVAGLALAVVSLGLQVTGGITDYFDSLKSRDQDIASIIQQNDTLKKTLQVIESSISRFQNDHRTATEALRQFLDSSNDELKVLEGMVATLTTNDQGSTDRKTKARNKGKKLLYPFHRPKLEQMATKLHHINATLQLGLQSLGLSVSHLGSEKLATLQVTSQTISSDLLLVQSEVSSISSPIRGMQSTLSQFERRFDGLEHLLEQLLVQGSNTNEKLQDITPALVTGRLLGKPAVLREMCDAVATQEQHRPKGKPPVPHERAAKVRTNVSSYTGGRFSCLCRHRRHVQYWNTAVGSLVLAHETTTERHLPGCPATRAILEPDRSQRFDLTYAGLRILLNSVIHLSLTIRSGAGGSSFGPSFTYYPIVDSKSAPAFRMMSLLMRSRHIWWSSSKSCGLLEDRVWQGELLPSVVSSVLSLFQTRRASPRAVNECKESLVYSAALCIRYCYGAMSLKQLQADTSQTSPLLDLLEYLVNNKAPANDYNTSGDTPLSAMFLLESYGSVSHPVPVASADLILRSNTDSAIVNRRGPNRPLGMKIVKPSGKVIWISSNEVLHHFLSSSTRIADAYGCGPLSLAILSNNLEEVKLLIANHPSTLSERNLFGHTPLHLAAGKPSILRVLVDAADIILLNETDHLHSSALDLAISFSGTKCGEDKTRMCKRCRCAECAVILMKADCMIRALTLRPTLEYASKRCKLRYLRYMKDRRERLKQLALENLSGTDIEQLGLKSEHVLDSNASKVTRLLQQRGVCVPKALAMVQNEQLSYDWSIYRMITSSDDADTFFRFGFRDTASWCDADDVARWVTSNWRSPSYLHWLATHGGICCQIPFPTVKDIFGSACIFSAIGREVKDSWIRSCSRFGKVKESDSGNSLPASPTVDPDMAWYYEVHSAAFEARAVDSCSCQCSPRGCNMLTFILKEMVNQEDYIYKPQHYSQDDATTDKKDLEHRTLNSNEPLLKLIDGFIIYLSHFSCHFQSWHHYASIRFITYAALGIGHSCCRWDQVHRVFESDIDSDEDGLGDDQCYKLEVLEDLINEFEKTITSLLEDPDTGTGELIDFWERTWVDRMSEVLDRLEGSDLPEDEKLAAEEIGVVWDKVGPEPPGSDPKERGNPYREDMIEYWLHELRKIEEECQ